MKKNSNFSIRIPISRMRSLEELLKAPLRYYLHMLSRKHLNSSEYQMVIYSFDHVSHMINLDGVYEKDYLDIFFYWMKKYYASYFDKCALDVGANIGNHSVYFSKFFREVIGFEPHPKTFQILNLNTLENERIKVFNFGISNASSTAYISENPLNMGGSRLVNDSYEKNHKVSVKKIDEIINIESDIGLIKIDTEGFELNVLKGAKKIILKNKPFIIFEQQTDDFANGISKVVEQLKLLNYRKFGIIKRKSVINFSFSSKIGMLLSRVLGLIFSEKYELNVVDNIPKEYYPFIIAIPDK